MWPSIVIHAINSANGAACIHTGKASTKSMTHMKRHKHTLSKRAYQCRIARSAILPHEKMISVVMFIGDAKLKTKDKPANVMSTGLYSFIKSHRKELLSAEQVDKALADIETKRLTPGRQTNRKHVAHVKSIKDRRV